jgi:hypothetical protein
MKIIPFSPLYRRLVQTPTHRLPWPYRLQSASLMFCGEKITMEKRSKGQRRWGLEVTFPLVDINGVTVIRDRRTLPDRRLDNISMDERLTLLSEMPYPIAGPGENH